ncbi:MAG: asparagine synthetase A [Candidatus Asgardarchaeia archaeon]
MELEAHAPRSLKEGIKMLWYRYRILSDEKVKAILRIQDKLFGIFRRFFEEEGFIQVLPPIIGPTTDPGIRGAKQVEFDYYGKKFKLMSSMIIYKQMLVGVFDKVYSFSPNIRLEPLGSIKTRRHLTEFFQVDWEAREWSYKDAMRLGERMLNYIISKVKKLCREELEILSREIRVPKSYKVYTYAEVLELLKELGYEVSYGKEIPWDAEEAISRVHDEPFWVVDYPVGSRGFYYLEDPERPGILRTMDLIYPDGFGEAISGGEREYRYERVVELMKKEGLSLSEYGWYLEMLKERPIPSAGFGIGFERLTRYLSGVREIYLCGPFTKLPGVYSP